MLYLIPRPPNMFSPALNRSFGQTEDITSGGNDITYGKT